MASTIWEHMREPEIDEQEAFVDLSGLDFLRFRPHPPRDVIDVNERGEQAMREALWDGKIERKPLNEEQGCGDWISG